MRQFSSTSKHFKRWAKLPRRRLFASLFHCGKHGFPRRFPQSDVTHMLEQMMQDEKSTCRIPHGFGNESLVKSPSIKPTCFFPRKVDMLRFVSPQVTWENVLNILKVASFQIHICGNTVTTYLLPAFTSVLIVLHLFRTPIPGYGVSVGGAPRYLSPSFPLAL